MAKQTRSKSEKKEAKGKKEPALPVPGGDYSPATGTPDTLHRYLAEISRYPLLTREEEQSLTRQYYETRDPEIASKIVTANLRLVVKIALDFQKFWMQNFLDLIQEGNIGLMQAVKKFDPFKGVKFSYYASFWIKAYILKFIMDNWRLVKIGTTQAQRKLFYNLQKEKDRIQALGFEPAPKLISQRLNVSEQEVIDMEQRMGSWEVSLDAPIKGDSDNKHMDFLPSSADSIEAEVARKEADTNLKELLREFGEGLEGKEKVIFEERMLSEEPKTLQELGKVFNVSRERVRQIEVRLKKKLRQYLEEKITDLDSYASIME